MRHEKRTWILTSKSFKFLVRLKRFELLAYRFVACCSIQLSYSRITRKRYSRTARIRQAFFPLPKEKFFRFWWVMRCLYFFICNINILDNKSADAPETFSSGPPGDGTVARQGVSSGPAKAVEALKPSLSGENEAFPERMKGRAACRRSRAVWKPPGAASPCLFLHAFSLSCVLFLLTPPIFVSRLARWADRSFRC